MKYILLRDIVCDDGNIYITRTLKDDNKILEQEELMWETDDEEHALELVNNYINNNKEFYENLYKPEEFYFLKETVYRKEFNREDYE